MESDTQPATAPKWMFWVGWIMSILPALMLVMSGVMKFVMVVAKPPDLLKGLTDLGFHEDHLLGLGIVELACTVIYLFPRTAVLGAILLTGYLGGAVAAHVRVFEPFFVPIVLGVLVWGGLFLRDPRLRALLPLRS